MLLAHVERMINESGDPLLTSTFVASAWLARWLDTPLAALGGQTPARHLESTGGPERVTALLLSMQSGTFW